MNNYSISTLRTNLKTKLEKVIYEELLLEIPKDNKILRTHFHILTNLTTIMNMLMVRFNFQKPSFQFNDKDSVKLFFSKYILKSLR